MFSIPGLSLSLSTASCPAHGQTTMSPHASAVTRHSTGQMVALCTGATTSQVETGKTADAWCPRASVLSN